MKIKLLTSFILILFFCLNLLNSKTYGISKFDIISLPSSSGSISATNTLDFDVVLNPLFPSIVEFPPFGDILSKRPGFAIVGSNPTYEIKLNIKSNNIDIKTINLTDSTEKVFKDISFTTSKVENTSDRLLITLEIPDSTSTGSAELALNLADSSRLIGELEIADFLKTKVKKTKTVLGKPSITRLSEKKNKGIYFITVKGKNFSPKNIIYSNGSIENESSDPENTSVTIFPQGLNTDILETKFEDTESIRIKLSFPEDLNEATDITVVITTPRGITSKDITINKKFGLF